MSKLAKLFLPLTLMLCLVVPALAAQRGDGEDRDRIEQAQAFEIVDQTAPLAIGAPNGLAMADVWVTINAPLTGDFHTDKTWCYVSDLQVFGNFITNRIKNVTVSIDVKRTDGTSALIDPIPPYTAAPTPNQVLSHTFVIGRLDVGYYKIVYKAKQGTTVVGQSFWIQVQPCVPRPNDEQP